MVKRNGSYPAEVMENMRGGVGAVKIERLLTPAELNEKGRLYAIITMEPGTSIGFHIHEEEMESYYIISGEAEYVDGEETVMLHPGDTTHTPVGCGHAIKCVGDAPLTLVAQILHK